MSDYIFSSKDPDHWGESYQSLWGCHNICPLLEQFHIICVTQTQLVSLTCQKAWGDADKFCSDITFLLILPKESKVEERTYGLDMVWVHPYQVRVSTIEETIKQLDQLTPWAQLALCPGVTQWGCPPHALPMEGHLSVMTEGSTSSLPCR